MEWIKTWSYTEGCCCPRCAFDKIDGVLRCCNTAQWNTFWGQQLLTDIRRMQAFPAENVRARCCDYGKNWVCVLFVCARVCMNAWEFTLQNFKGLSFCVSNSHLLSAALILCSYFYSIAIYVLKPNTLFEGLFKEKKQVSCNDLEKCVCN